jgi:hypothetical protein
MLFEPVKSQSRFGLSAGTSHRFEVRAYLESVDLDANYSDLTLNIFVNSGDFARFDEPFADALLISDDDEAWCPTAQRLKGGECRGEPFEFLPVPNVVANYLAVDDAIPVQE